MRQADVVVQLDIDQIAELGEVDVAASIFIRPSEQVVDAVVVQGQRVLQLNQQLLQFIPVDLARIILVDALEHALQVVELVRQPRALRLEVDVISDIGRPPGAQSPVVYFSHRTFSPNTMSVDFDLVTCAGRNSC